MALQTDQGSAKCLPNSAETAQFRQYIDSCRTQQDTRIAGTFLSGTIEQYIALFDSYRSQYTDLMISADGLNSSTTNVGALDDSKNTLHKQKEKLKAEIKYNRRVSNSADKTFLEDIYNKTPPKKTLIPNLDDIVLLLFWFSWLVMSIVLVAVRWTSPGGGWMAGLFTGVILLLVTVCVFALIAQLA
jgi:hypothetical protein